MHTMWTQIHVSCNATALEWIDWSLEVEHNNDSSPLFTYAQWLILNTVHVQFILYNLFFVQFKRYNIYIFLIRNTKLATYLYNSTTVECDVSYLFIVQIKIIIIIVMYMCNAILLNTYRWLMLID